MIQIKNKRQLIEQGNSELMQKARALALTSLEYALNAANPEKIMHSAISLKNSVLSVGRNSFDLRKFKHLYVVGGGKASGSMAEALEKILGNRITAGAVNVPYGSKHKTKVIKIHEASHPLPDEAGVEGTRRILEIAGHAEKDDLVICLISGGGQA